MEAIEMTPSRIPPILPAKAPLPLHRHIRLLFWIGGTTGDGRVALCYAVSFVVFVTCTGLRVSRSFSGLFVILLAAFATVILSAATVAYAVSRWWHPGDVVAALTEPARKLSLSPRWLAVPMIALTFSTAFLVMSMWWAEDYHALMPRGAALALAFGPYFLSQVAMMTGILTQGITWIILTGAGSDSLHALVADTRGGNQVSVLREATRRHERLRAACSHLSSMFESWLLLVVSGLALLAGSGMVVVVGFIHSSARVRDDFERRGVEIEIIAVMGATTAFCVVATAVLLGAGARLSTGGAAVEAVMASVATAMFVDGPELVANSSAAVAYMVAHVRAHPAQFTVLGVPLSSSALASVTYVCGVLFSVLMQALIL